MIIAIPQYKGTVSGAYELSQTVSVHRLDVVQGCSLEDTVHPFPAVRSACDWFCSQDVKAVLVGTIDPDNAEELAGRGINVFMGADDLAPAENVTRFLRYLDKAWRRTQGDLPASRGPE